jgi:hypothetical protein
MLVFLSLLSSLLGVCRHVDCGDPVVVSTIRKFSGHDSFVDKV